MRHQSEVNDNARLSAQQAQVVRVIRFSGVVMTLIGVCAFFDVGGVATALGLGEASVNQILGGTMMIAGLVEIFVLPRIFEKMKSR